MSDSIAGVAFPFQLLLLVLLLGVAAAVTTAHSESAEPLVAPAKSSADEEIALSMTDLKQKEYNRKNKKNLRGRRSPVAAGASGGTALWDLTPTVSASSAALAGSAGVAVDGRNAVVPTATTITGEDMKDMISWMKESMMDGIKKEDIRSGKTTIMKVLDEIMDSRKKDRDA